MNVTLTVEQSGLRADQYLAGVLDGLTRSAAQKLLEEGRVLRRGKALKKNDKLQAGDEVAVCIPTPRRWRSCPRTSRWTWCMRTGT